MRISGIAVVSSIAIPETVSLSSVRFQVSHNTTPDKRAYVDELHEAAPDRCLRWLRTKHHWWLIGNSRTNVSVGVLAPRTDILIIGVQRAER